MEDEDLEIQQMIKNHKKAGGVILGEGEIRQKYSMGGGLEVCLMVCCNMVEPLK